MLLLLGYAMMCAYLYLFQRAIIYHPDAKYGAPSPSLLPDMQEVDITTSDKRTLRSWYQPPRTIGLPTILFLHGNRGGLTERTETYRDIVDAGYGVLALDYRGYSGNSGSPSEQGLYEDGRAAMAFLYTRETPPEHVILMGHSLGTGVAVQLATEYPVRALVLLAPYTAIAEIGASHYWYAPVSLLLEDRFDSLSKAGNVTAPVFIFHGKQDETIPYDHAKRLYAAFHAPKKMILFKHRDHNGLSMPRVLEVMQSLPSRK
jgi:uncharacterized protein